MPKNDMVMIPAIVERASPERTQYKPYSSDLAFDGKVIVEIPVPAEEVRKEKDTFILTLKGWTIFLDTYATEVERMDDSWKQASMKGQRHKPYRRD